MRIKTSSFRESKVSAEEQESEVKSPTKKGPPPRWDEFLKARYDEGKKKIPNPNPDTRSVYPQVSLSTALKFEVGGKHPIYEKLKHEYQSWLKTEAPEKKDKNIDHNEYDVDAKKVHDQGKPEPKLTADDILYKQLGNQMGSNPGGTYEGKDGIKRYVKFYRDSSQAYCEHVTNEIYKSLGLQAPNSHIFEKNGKTAYASDFMSNLKTFGNSNITKEMATDAMKGFAADVLVCNWDAAGTGLDNFNYRPDIGTVRIDQGGALLFRAQGAPKPEGALYGLGEWDSFISMNPYYAQVARTAGFYSGDDMKELATPMIDKIEKMSKQPGGWKGFVEKHAKDMNSSDKEKVIKMLDTRTKLLIQKRDEGSRSKSATSKRARQLRRVAEMQTLIAQILNKKNSKAIRGR